MLQNALNEDLIHYIWKTKRIEHHALSTAEGEPIYIDLWGTHNHHSGPDFSNAKIKIGDTLWAGNVEMHISSSDWDRHGHSDDPAYDNVILHVVWEHDKKILDANGRAIPTLVISDLVDPNLISTYIALMQNELSIPCENLIDSIDLDQMNLWIHSILVERLEQKTKYLKSLLEQTRNDWNQVFFIALTKYMGLKVNAEPFEQLARSFDIQIIWKNANNLHTIEAILFGQAGMLGSSSGDDYYLRLKREYEHQSTKYNLQPISTVGWKFARMRPANFPTIRIAQMARIIYQHTDILSKLLVCRSIDDIGELLQVSPSDYWTDHYMFNKESVHRPKPVGDNLTQVLIINVVVPFLFLYGKELGNDTYQDQSILYLEQCTPESNHITKLWKSLGISATSAYFTQGLIQLKTKYCDKKQCLRCPIGNQILRN